MKDFKVLSKTLKYGILTFFILPYILLIKFFTLNIDINSSELFWALKNSFIQSSLAATACVFLGSFLAFGIFQFNPGMRRLILKLVLLPQVLPSLFSILIAFSLVQPFPMGHFGVIFIFILINLGFAVFQISNAIQDKIGNLALVSEVFGIKSIQFYRKILIPLLWSDIKLNFTLIFLFCFSSLSIPLVAGGGKGTNLEVLIFEKIYIDQNWSTAWLMMVVQVAIVFSLSYFFLKSQSHEGKSFVVHKFVKSKMAAVGILLYLLIYIGGYLFNLVQSVAAFDIIGEYAKEIIASTVNTIFILSSVLLICYAVLLAWMTDYIQNLRHNMAIHLISASTVLVGFSLYIFFPGAKVFDFIKIPLAFVILFFPFLFKMFFEKNIDKLKKQILVSKIFGLSNSKIIFEVVFKQIRRPAFLAVSLLSIWTLSDFAILRSLGTQTQTLGLITQSFLSSYRLSAAYLVSFYVLIVWLVICSVAYFLIEGFHVDHKKH
ncbi:MAG: ABC transporter permease subunit [Pseudobdellovibrio sp.]